MESEPTAEWTEPAVQGMVDLFLKGYLPPCPLCGEPVDLQEESQADDRRRLLLGCAPCGVRRAVILGKSRGPRNWSKAARNAIRVGFNRHAVVHCPEDGTRLEVQRSVGTTSKYLGVRRRFQCPLCLRRMEDIEPTATIDSPAFNQRYKVVGNLGVGGFGVVDLVEHRRTGVRYAAKTILPDHFGDARVIKRLKQEAGLYKAIEHENVVSLADTFFDEAAREYVLVIEYVEGGSLKKAINDPSVSDADLVKYISDVASGLRALHANGVVHRDLKPANVLVDRAERIAKITDLGLAALIEYEVVPIQDTGRVGTPIYAAPEQRGGDGEVGPRADLWAFALMIYEVATRRSPYTDLEELDAFPVFFRELLRRALQKHPARRVTSARELASGLRRLHRS